jgi:tetrahedral aminopeptidase
MSDLTLSPQASVPAIGVEQIALLEKLCNATAVSGDESAVRAIIIEQLKPIADELKVDALGNVLVTRKSRVSNPLRVMIAAHMDEVGFMLIDDDKEGIFRFALVGGIDERQLIGKPVLVGKDRVPGVIGACPIHFLTDEDMRHKIPVETLRIDLGPGGASKAKLGDRGTFATIFRQTGPSFFAKSLDNRLGVASLIELVKRGPYDVELLAAFTVQEEVGVRGARVAAYAFNPDLAIALDATPAYDLPTWDASENTFYNSRLGEGPAIYLADAGTLSDPRLLRFLIETAETEKIPFQLRQPGGGGTDAGAIHKQRAGIPSISISVPHRATHSAISIARLADWENTLKLMDAALKRMTAKILDRR